MEGFKTTKKIACFKEGGQVKYESRKEHKEEMSADIAQDKKIVKKAIRIHDEQEHKGEKTDLSKLRKGGRAKKKVGTVRKYAEGGGVLEAIKAGATKLKDNIMGTPEQNRIAKESIDKQAREGSKLAKFFGGNADAPSAPVNKKCGGKIKKYGVGGAILKATKSQLAPAALFGPAAGAAVYSDMKSQERKAAEEASKDKEAEAKSAAVNKCKGGKIKKMADGGGVDSDIVSKYKDFIKSGKGIDPGMTPNRKFPVKTIDGKEIKPVPMPYYGKENRYFGDIEETKPGAPRMQLLKRGGKAKK